MDFIINHSGFIFGIVLIVVLAIIGYFADKKDNEKKVINDKSVDKTASNVVVSGSLDSFNELPSVDNNVSFNVENSNGDMTSSVSDLSNVVDNSFAVDSNSSVVPSQESISNDVNLFSQDGMNISTGNVEFNSNDFENLDFSLEDLEKKNFDNITKTQVNNDDENFYYSDMDDSLSDVSIPEVIDDFKDIDDDSIVQNDEGVNNLQVSDNAVSENDDVQSDGVIDDTVSDNNLQINDNVSSENNDVQNEASLPESDLINDVVTDNEVIQNEIEAADDLENVEDTSHLFDNETSNDVSNLGNTESDEFRFSNNIDGQQSVPELFDNNQFGTEHSFESNSAVANNGSLNLSDDVSDDIWKF